jgi:hypothetical protein
MLRVLLTLLACAAFAVPAFAQGESTRPASTSDVGPWEAVVWTRGKIVVRCTMSRARNAPDGLSYGFLIDREGILLGVANKSFAFTSEAALSATLSPQVGAAQKVTARPVSNVRANLELTPAVLEQLQRSDHTDVVIGGRAKVRLPLDDFNAARVVLEICVQKIGKPHERGG